MIKRSLASLPRHLRPRTNRPFSTSHSLAASHNDRQHTNVDQHRDAQKSKPLNPHMPNTSSTLANEMPKVGNDSAPPEFLSSVDGSFKPSDKAPGNIEKMTGGTQAESNGSSGSKDGASVSDLNVGEIEGGSFRVEPLRRTGEDRGTIIARLTYQSRKRGTLESDLLLSTFADAQLSNMTVEQLGQYDLFLDENDWDIYYWATQEPTPTSLETAEGSVSSSNSTSVSPQEQQQKSESSKRPPAAPASGEWAQTVGTFKPAYRPVPQRWQGSEILTLLREHVETRKKDGMAFMPRLKSFER